MPEIAVRLRGQAEMLEHLKQVSESEWLVENFYPILLGRAGTTTQLLGVVMFFAEALQKLEAKAGEVVANIALANVDRYIDAIVAHELDAEAVKQLWHQMWPE